ncbi:GNAT family N-acetyltransferase [Undibacterium sp. SXout11W]|uniref:GNAT family N-acetyltransferase n=1 Tax=Undibacterium sp. SXout11W TaxID=3413050 RepID=UPI003BF0C06E
MSFHIRLMREKDLPAVHAVQALAYVAEMVEPLDLLKARLQTSPETAWVAENKDGIGAYLVAYPSQRGKISALGSDFDLSYVPNALYIHDVAVAPRMAGQGVAVALVQQAVSCALAKHLQYGCLVSVQNSLSFWEKLGFLEDRELSPEQSSLLSTYTGAAYYCSKKLFTSD